MDTIKKILVFLAVVLWAGFSFAEPYALPSDGQKRTWGGSGDTWMSRMNPVFNYFDATGGVLPEYPVVLGPLSVSGAGNSWLELGNNTSFTDVLTGKGGYGLLNWLPYAILNGEQKRLALFEELAAGDTSIIQDDDPTLASATGKYYSRASGGYFNVVHGVEMFALAGTRTADETGPAIEAGADGSHDGTTAVTATMVLTELYPDPSTLLYTVTGGTPASGTWAGTYPNYSVEITPTGTDDIVVTSSGSDLAGNAATGTDLVQEFVYDSGSLYTTVFSDDFNRADNTNVITGSAWTSESDTGIGSIASNKFLIAKPANTTSSARINKTGLNYSDYEVTHKVTFSDVTGLDTSGVSDVCASLSLYTTAGVYVSVLYYTNTAGDIIGIKLQYYNDAGVSTVVSVPMTISANTENLITIRSDNGLPATADGVLYVTVNGTEIVNITNSAAETRPVLSEIRLGYGVLGFDQAFNMMIDDFVLGTK